MRRFLAVLAFVGLLALPFVLDACSPLPTTVGCSTFDSSADTVDFAIGDSVYAACDEV